MVSLRSVASNVGDGVREGTVLDENKALTPSKDGCAKSCEAAETAGELESKLTACSEYPNAWQEGAEMTTTQPPMIVARSL